MIMAAQSWQWSPHEYDDAFLPPTMIGYFISLLKLKANASFPDKGDWSWNEKWNRQWFSSK